MCNFSEIVDYYYRKQFPIVFYICSTIQYFQNIRTVVLAPDDERMIAMKETYINEINELLTTKDENQLLYILTFIKSIFGSL